MILRVSLLIMVCFATGCSSAATDKRDPADGGGDDGEGDIIDLTLTWDAFEAESATFNIYARVTPDDDNGVGADTLIAGDLTVDDQTTPTLTLTTDDNSDLQPFVGKKTCFWLVAVVDNVESEPSDTSCVDL